MQILIVLKKIALLIVITICVVLLSTLFYFALLLYSGEPWSLSGFKRTIIIPCFVVPIVASYWINKYFHIADLEQRLKQLLTVDDLTGVTTRRAFFEKADKLISRSIQSDQPVSLLLVDLDNFKAINDSYGHTGGDRVLAAFGDLLLEFRQKTDVVARLGGEEFVILMTNTNKESALFHANKLLVEVQRNEVMFEGDSIFYSVSCGVAELCDVEPKNVERLIVKADKSLYKAKHSGRNRVFAL